MVSSTGGVRALVSRQALLPIIAISSCLEPRYCLLSGIVTLTSNIEGAIDPLQHLYVSATLKITWRMRQVALSTYAYPSTSERSGNHLADTPGDVRSLRWNHSPPSFSIRPSHSDLGRYLFSCLPGRRSCQPELFP